MLRYQIKRILEPIRLWPRRALLLPSIEEQSFVGTRVRLYRACQFASRNYATGDYIEPNPQLELIEYWRDVLAIAFIVNFKDGTGSSC